MNKALAIIATFILVMSAAFAARAVMCDEPVKTQSGLVRGMADIDTATCSWKGIPFAAPPVGELRWKAPLPPPEWDGVMDMTEFGARCMQQGLMAAVDIGQDLDMSEDCLYLNIWRPQKSGLFPVMIWIHGGGYTGGTGSTEMYWGDRLADLGDVVLVSINYRLNVFGFLAHPGLKDEDPNGSTGNYGSLDQIAAIQWVHDNIEGFGGDPQNVLIFGESAGGWSVCTMLATPLNKGLINKAVLESGGCEASSSLERGYEQARGVAEQVKCSYDDLDCLRAAKPEKLLDATGSQLDGFTWVPRYDGYLLTDSPLNMIRSDNYNHVPFIAGSNRDEVDVVLKLLPQIRRGRAKKYQHKYQRFLGVDEAEAQKLVSLYPLSQYGDVFGGFGQAMTDAGLGCPTYNGLASVSEHQDDVWLYRFQFDQMSGGKAVQAAHAMEIAFIFNNLDRKPISALYTKKTQAIAQPLADKMLKYWTNFALSGDPNGAGLPEWPRFNEDSQRAMIFDTEVRAEPAGMAEKCEFWDNYNQTHGPVFENLHGFLK